MTAQDKLKYLKSDLQLLTAVHDEYLAQLLEIAEAAINREGVKDDDTADYNGVVTSYAAWLFRKRAASTAGGGGFAPSGGETAMPRFLRWQLNNLLMSQKITGVPEKLDDNEMYLTVKGETP